MVRLSDCPNEREIGQDLKSPASESPGCFPLVSGVNGAGISKRIASKKKNQRET